MIKFITKTKLPTKNGLFDLYLYQDTKTKQKHLALVCGDINKDDQPIPVRIHSACLTGDVLGSLRCDCQAQLHRALKKIQKMGLGILIYLDQEGRGIGLINKIKAYVLQDKGLDTVQANLKLGFKEDERNYQAALDILKKLKIKKIKLMTNNPQKITEMKNGGLTVTRMPFWIKDNGYDNKYLQTKKNKMGHLK